MSQQEDRINRDASDLIHFDTISDFKAPDHTIEQSRWKIIIADDQEEVHSVTKLVLDDYSFKSRGIELLSAYSGIETKKMIEKYPDVALILLDVVMETDDAGLEVVRHIREKLKNNIVQIVLSTGQPGQAPEQEVITKYDINDYKSKTEFNARKLITCVTSSLRAYELSYCLNQANIKLNNYRNHLEKLVKERTLKLEKTNEQLKSEIEERKRAEIALNQNNEILNNILAASPIGICLVEDNLIQWANDEMKKIFQYTHKKDFNSKNMSIFYPSEKENHRVNQTIYKQLETDKPIEVDATFKRQNGSTFFGHLMMSCSEPSNPMKRAILTISDISWRKQAELDHTQKERFQGALEMAGSICHELNQPLQYISGASEIIIMDMPDDEQFNDTIYKIKKQVDRMGKITRQLMGITKYKTRDYVGGSKIIDIDKASRVIE